MVPGTRALAFAARWFDASTVSNVFEPLVADWQREWRDAAGFARFGVRVRGGSALLLSMIAASPTLLLEPWPAGALRKIITRITVWTMVVSAVMLMPFINDLGRRVDVSVSLYLFLLLLPSTIAIAFPVAITTVVDVIRTAPQPVREERLAAVRVGIAAVALMALLVGWAFPAANQQYRVAAAQALTKVDQWPTRGPAPGFKELSLFELANDISLKSELWVGRESWASGRAELIRTEIGRRTYLMVIPVAMIWMRWRALLLPRGRWYSAWPLAISAPVTAAMFYSMLAQRALADVIFAPRWSGPWLALTLVIAGAIVIDRVRRAGLKTRLYARAD